MTHSKLNLTLPTATLVALVAASSALAGEYLNGIKWAQPAIVTPGATDADPPSDAVVLFDGADLSQWNNGENWKVEDGHAITGKGPIVSKDEFGDCQLHIEWSAPLPPKGTGQGRGNSGVFLMGKYEIQILDSYENETYHDGQAGAIYKQTPPAVNAIRKPGQWNTYDIFWTAPRFNDDGSLKLPAYMTAVHNGVLILSHFELKGDTRRTAPKDRSRCRITVTPSVSEISGCGNSSRLRASKYENRSSRTATRKRRSSSGCQLRSWNSTLATGSSDGCIDLSGMPAWKCRRRASRQPHQRLTKLI